MIPLRRLLSLLPLLLAGVALASEIDARSRLVWAHYTPWFQPVDTVELAVRQDNACDLPLAGDLDRRLAAEIAGARAMGADGFLVDVVMHARQRPDTAYLRRMLAVAAREGFLVGLCLDPVHADAQAIAAGAAALLDDCAGLPAYPLVGGRPLLSTYRVREDGPAVWRQVRAELRRGGRDPFLLGDLMSPNLVLDAEAVDAYAGCFDGLYQFCEYGGSRSAAGRPQPPAAAEAVLAAAAARQGLVHAGLVMPGYLGRWHQGRNPYHLPFHGFQVLLGWGRLAGAGRPGWLHLTTWNDHDETALMPTVFTGAVNTELVAALVADWRGGARVAARPRCHLAYPREVLVGTPLHIDCLVQMGQDAGPATVSGRLLDPQGRTVAELAPRTLAGGALAGTGWTLDSAALAAWSAVIPRLCFAAGDGGAIERDAPMIRPVAGWIQNQVVVKATLQELAPGPTRLVLRQQGAGVEAEVAVAGDDPVVAASLWRNDRPLAAFDPAGGPAALLVEIVPCARTHTDLEVELGPRGGRIVRAAEAGPWKEGDGDGRTVAVDAQGGVRMHLAMALPQHLPRRRLMALWQAAGDDRLRVRLRGAGQEAVLELSAAELAAGDGVLALDGEGRPLAELRCPDCDPWLDALIAPLAAPTTLRFRRLTRPARPGDLWHARVRFASGRTAESPPVAASDALCEGVVLSGAGDLDDDGAREVGAAPPREATAAASGLPPVGTMRTLAMPRAVARAASWNFEGDLTDAIGDRDLAVPGAQRPLEAWRRLLVVADGRGCLRLGGAELALRTRSWPAGPCRIALTVRIDEVAGEGGLLAGRSGGSSAVAIRIRADRSLEAVRDGGGEAVRVHLADPVPRNAWVRITARYDGGTLALSCDGRTATVAAPAVQFQHNCTPLLGQGVHGLVEAFEVSSCPGPPL